MPRRVDHDKRRSEILLEARAMVAEGGFDALRMRDLAERCGYAHGAIRHYFSDKDDLVHQLVVDAALQLSGHLTLRGYREARGLAALRLLYADLVGDDPELLTSRLILSGLTDVLAADDRVRALLRVRVTQLREYTLTHLHEALDDGEVTGGRPLEVSAAMLVHVCAGVLSSLWLRHDDPLAAYADREVEAVLATA